jgi:hypothetical protein
MSGHKTEGIWLVLGTNGRFVQFLDAGLLVPYKGNNTYTINTTGGKVVLLTSLISLKVCTIQIFAVFHDSYKAQTSDKTARMFTFHTSLLVFLLSMWQIFVYQLR